MHSCLLIRRVHGYSKVHPGVIPSPVHVRLCCFHTVTVLPRAHAQSFVVVFVVVVCAQEAPPSHDILVFMTGQEEIEALARTCRDIAKHLPDSCGPMVVVPLYASLPPVQQLRVFQPAPKVKAAAAKLGGDAGPQLLFLWLHLLFFSNEFYRLILDAFDPCTFLQGCRKVILSTNIAETSVTISRIKHVIDTGMVKAKRFNPGSIYSRILWI